MPKLIRMIVVAMAFVSACGGGSGGAGASFCQEYAAAECKKMYACPDPSLTLSGSEASCTAAFAKLCSDPPSGGITADVNCSGGKQVDESARTACLNSIANATCTDYNSGNFVSGCDQVCVSPTGGASGGGFGGSSGSTGGGGTGGSPVGTTGSCSMNATCGGTLDGTWNIDTTCVVGSVVDLFTGQQNLPAACSNLFQTATLSAAGTMMYANGMETDNVTVTINATVIYTSACVSAMDNTAVTLTAATCSSLQSGLLSSGTFSTAACSFTGGNCVCAVVNQQQSPTTPQAYTISGGQISYADGSTSTDYCVQGTTLTIRSADSGVTIVNTAHRL